MEKATEILNELTSLSPLIAGMKKVNVFTVPGGYFESISKTLVACIREEAGILNPVVPMQASDVPAGYFDHLANSILNKIKAAETASDEIRNFSPLLYSIQNKNVFEVPVGYFDGLNSNIIDKLRVASTQDELEEISPLLHNMLSKKLFEVPDGYFAGLADIILSEVQPPTAKVVRMRRTGIFVKYAVAAMMTGVMALGLYRYIDKPGHVESIDGNNTVAALDSTVEKGKNMNDLQFNRALENLTEADIAKYLDKNGDITDVAVLGNNLDENNLPSQEDYLLNETTLEDYLKEIDKATLKN